MTDLQQIAEDLQNLPQEVQKGFARLEALKELTGANAFQADALRLDQQQRAIRKQQGLDMPTGGDDDVGINNILADNITITDGVKKGIVTESPAEKPVQPPVESTKNGRAMWLATGLLTAGGLLLGGNLGWMLRPTPRTEPPPHGGSVQVERESVPMKVEYD